MIGELRDSFVVLLFENVGVGFGGVHSSRFGVVVVSSVFVHVVVAVGGIFGRGTVSTLVHVVIVGVLGVVFGGGGFEGRRF